MVIYMYIVQGQGQTIPWEIFFVKNINFLSNWSFTASFYQLMTYKSFPHSNTGKIGQGQAWVIIYINFVELESLMLHAKFQDHRTSSSGEEDF